MSNVEEPMAEDNWINWMGDLEGHQILFNTNLKFKDVRFREGTKLMVFEIGLRTAGEMGGFGSTAERERVWDIADELRSIGKKSGAFEEVSHTACRGLREYSYVLKVDQMDREIFVKVITEAYQDYKPDPKSYKWEYYDEWLYPRPQDFRWAEDSTVLDSLTGNGDLHHIPRKVDHRVGFETMRAARKFIDTIVDAGFTIDSLLRSDDEQDHLWWVNFSHITSVDINTIWGHTGRVTEFAEKYGGEYDGWGCLATTEEPDP